jgi:acetyl esterase/lipase
VTARQVEQYGDGELQRGEWWVPDDAGPLPTVVLVHGGYWRPVYDRSLEDPIATDLSARGYLCWNIDYAPASWPGTLRDVAAGYDHLVTSSLASRVDTDRIAVVGHSAGGHLALWLASRHRLPPDAPGAPGPTHVRPRLCVAQAPIAALADGSRQRLGGGAVDAFVGGPPDAVPDRYAVADPIALLPTGIRTVLVHGDVDDTVPLSQSETYVDAAQQADDEATLEVYRGEHFEHLDPASEAIALLHQSLTTLR